MATLSLRKPVSVDRLKALGVETPHSTAVPIVPPGPTVPPVPAALPTAPPLATTEMPTRLRRHIDVLDILRSLKERWPNSIGRSAPLKVGIASGIMLAMPDTDARLLKKALSAHCGSIPYQRALTAEGAMRVDLAGEPVEPVSPEHRDFAAAAIAEKRARKQRGNAVAPSHPQP